MPLFGRPNGAVLCQRPRLRSLSGLPTRTVRAGHACGDALRTGDDRHRSSRDREAASSQRPAGSGRPSYRRANGRPRVVRKEIPPGTYPVQVAVVAYEGQYEDQRFAVEEGVAIRLLLSAETPVSWELGLAEVDDARLPRDGEIFGFDIDGAAGSFADASAWEALADKYRRCHVDREYGAAESISDGYIRTTDEATGSDLVSFCTSGDGTIPVWLGHSNTGNLVCVVVVVDYLPELRLL
ncbi:DUF4241 domain-containing protein [Streptomyces sp. NPDC001212]